MSAHLLAKELPACAAGLLRFAAAPTFAILALLSSDGADMVCLHASPPPELSLGSMSVMYWVMGAFHLTPWLGLVSRR